MKNQKSKREKEISNLFISLKQSVFVSSSSSHTTLLSALYSFSAVFPSSFSYFNSYKLYIHSLDFDLFFPSKVKKFGYNILNLGGFRVRIRGF